MRPRNTFALVFAGLVGLPLVALLVLPGMLDWNRFRPEIALYASEALGRAVRIEGPVSLTLLPEPMLTAGKVAFTTPGAAEGGSMTATELRLRVTLRGLFAGRLDASELVLRGMDLRLPWPLPAAALVIRTPSWLGALSARVERGRVRLGSVELTGVEATLSTAEATGTWRAAGTATEGGRPWRFTVQLTQPGGDGAEGLDATLAGDGAAKGLGANLSGQVAASGAFAGRIIVHGPDLSQLLPAPPLPFRAEGRLTVDKGLAAADDLAADLGGAPLQGAVALRLSPAPRLDLALTASRLDLDAWWGALSKPRPPMAFPTIGIDLSTEAARLAGGTVRTLRAGLDLVPGAIELRELRAQLPGEADFRAAGRLTLPAGKEPARFDGSVALIAPAPRATLAWIAPTAAPPDGTLRRLALAGHVVADPAGVALDRLAGSIDDTTVAGQASFRAGARPSMAADLRFGDVDATPWLGLRDALGWLKLAGGIDADVKMSAQSVVAGAFRADHVAIALAAAAGRLELRQFEAGLPGARVTAQGSLLDGSRLADARVRLEGTAQALRSEALLPYWPERLLAALPDATPIWGAPLAVEATAGGTLPALSGKLTLRLGDLDGEITPSLDLASGKWSAGLALRHPGAPRLLEALGIRGATDWLGEGSLSLVAQVQGQPGRMAAERFDLAAGAMHAQGNLSLASAGAARTLGGRVDFDVIPLPFPDRRATAPMPRVDLAGWSGGVDLAAAHVLLGRTQALSDAKTRLAIADNQVRLDDLEGKLAGGTLAASLRLDTTANPPVLAVTATLGNVATAGLTEAPLDISSGTLDGRLDLRASGYSPSALLATASGSASLAWHDGVLAGVSLAALSPDLDAAAVKNALAGGSTRFSRLDLDLAMAGGIATLQAAHLDSPNGSIAGSGSLDLANFREDLRLDLSPPTQDPPRIGLRLTGPLDAPTRTPDLADLIRWRAARGP